MTRRDRLTYRILMVLGVSSIVVFYGWWLQPKHFPTNLTGWGHGVDVLIFGALTLVLTHRVFMDVYCWVVARKIEPLVSAPTPQPGLRVAFITTFVPGSEGLDLLQRTLPAMLRADYPHDVWLLDEGDDDEAKELCHRLGVHYFTRKHHPAYNRVAGPFTRRTKGGNHNAWYDAHGRSYDVVAQIDTDFLARKDFLTQTLGHFSDPGIAWVITPQIYGNTQRFVPRGSAEQQFTFYGPVLRGLSARGMANMLGANHVVRVAALDSIGYYAGHVTEDLLTGMRLHAKGWRSAYVPLPLAVGEGPDTWKAYFNQQHRWAYGCIEVLTYHTRTLTKEMPRQWRMLYVALQQGYFSGVAAALGVGLLMMYFFGGVQISRIPLQELLVWGAPFFVMRHVVRLWLQKFNVRPEEERGLQLSGALIAIAAWPVYLMALIRIARGQDLVFKVTPKGKVRKARGGSRQEFRPHAVIALANLACLPTAYLTGRDSDVLLAWATLNVVLLGGLWLAPDLLGSLRVSRRRPATAPVLTSVRHRASGRAGVAAMVSLPHEEEAGSPARLPGRVLTMPRQRRRADREIEVASTS